MEVDEPKSPIREERKPQNANTPVSMAQDMFIETPATPTTPMTPYTPVSEYNEYDDTEENDISNTSINTEKAFQVGCKRTVATPGPIKARRQLEENGMLNSPSDAMLSPCTAMLMGRGGKKEFYDKSSAAVSGPAAALRKKHVGSIPLKLDDE